MSKRCVSVYSNLIQRRLRVLGTTNGTAWIRDELRVQDGYATFRELVLGEFLLAY
ncbi:MAG: hypothetical protein R3E58_07040 [Phycisphaerae bacterium]